MTAPPGRGLMPATGADVVGTMHASGGELVVRLSPSRARDMAVEPTQPRTLAGLGCMRYVVPLTPEQRAQWEAALTRARLPWWRGWLPW